MAKPTQQVKPIRCVFVGYLWKIALKLQASPHVQLLGAGLEPQRSRSAEAESIFAKAKIPVFDARKLKSNVDLEAFLAQGADLLVVGAFGQILPPELLARFPHGALNVHTSYLPSYRGGSPIESQILAGDREGGVTLHWIDEGIDTGPIAAQRSLELYPDHDRYEDIFSRYHEAAADLMDSLLATPLESWPRVTQPAAPPAVPPVKESDFQVNWKEGAKHLRRKTLSCGWKNWVRFPLPEGDIVIQAADAEKSSEHSPGKVLRGGDQPLISTGENALVLREFQSPRKLVTGEMLSS